MLGGVVTEIGGLVSHGKTRLHILKINCKIKYFVYLILIQISGAVCAREYGLPCVVAAENATRLFKSGKLFLHFLKN